MVRVRDALLLTLYGATVVLIAGANYTALLYAPDEKVMGAVQRVFYFHVPSAIVAFLSTFVMLAGSIGYLWTRRRTWDNVARSATEIALLFAALVLITGPIWAKPAWGVWWTWEARLTTTLLLGLLLAASLMVRRYAESAEQGARIASVLGVVAALDVPIIYKAVDWWRGQHPVVFGPGQRDPLDPRMRTALLCCLIAFLALYGLLLSLRVRLAAAEDRARDLADTLADRGGIVA